jgi:hypothetical protein
MYSIHKNHNVQFENQIINRFFILKKMFSKLTSTIFKSLYRLCKKFDKMPHLKLYLYRTKEIKNENYFKKIFPNKKQTFYIPEKSFRKILLETVRNEKKDSLELKMKGFKALKYLNNIVYCKKIY